MTSIVPQDDEDRPTEPEFDHEAEATMRSGANWFYWIAGLSIVNSVIFMFGGEVNFILGLAITQVVDGLVSAAVFEGAPEGLKYLAIGINLVIAFLFVLFGYFSNKRFAAAFIVGILIYVVDGLIYLYVGDLFAAGFHVFALFFIIRGFLASRRLANSISPTAI